MDFALSPQEEAFRKELCDWLDANTPELRQRMRRLGRQESSMMEQGEPGPESRDFTRWWHKKLHDAGYVGITWPKQYGGRGSTLMEQVIFNEEMAKRRVPTGVGGLGIGWAGPTIMAAGSEEQKNGFCLKSFPGKRSGVRHSPNLKLVLTWLTARPGQ
jgi:alkylation response protein AidB-like acyl-CoA dehydrogenase